MAQLTGVYRGKRGVLYPFARFLGFRSCDLAAITESRRGPSPAWKTLIATLEGEGHTHIVVSSAQASPEISLASAGREPCVLITHDSGDIAMIVDWNDLALARDVATYERILRSKLLMY